MTAPADREFGVLAKGFIRDRIVLANFRNGLRKLVNPETGALFTEDEIARATQAKSRWWIEANAIDDLGQAEQRRAIYLSDQVRIERASTSFLEGFHGKLWDETKLPASGGSGSATVRAVPGTIVVGSSTIGDAAAYWARDPAGKKYQVFTTVTTPAAIAPASLGVAPITLAAIDTGDETNLEPGTVLTWITRDPNMEPTVTVTSQFGGGTDVENDAEFASRLLGGIRHKQGAGNDPQMRAWGRKASNGIEDAFIYPCFLYAGSTLVAITQKRAGVAGPDARIPSAGLLQAAISYLTPPASAVVPGRFFVLVTKTNKESSNLVLRLSMPKASAAGWTDAAPFPSYHATTPSITTVTSQTDIQITCPGDATLPGQAAGATLSGANAPQLMVWNEARSEWVKLAVTSVQDLGSSVYRVVLSANPNFTLAVGQVVSPDVGRRAIIAGAVVEYFDELGPGDLFDTSVDPRGGRCVRFPRITEEHPFRAGAAVATRAIEALGGTASDATLASISLSTPSYPAVITSGPNMLVPGTVGVYVL